LSASAAWLSVEIAVKMIAPIVLNRMVSSPLRPSNASL
jgi:hypothetical protein